MEILTQTPSQRNNLRFHVGCMLTLPFLLAGLAAYGGGVKKLETIGAMLEEYAPVFALAAVLLLFGIGKVAKNRRKL